jgi:SecD/SecF fusion protein
MSEVLTRSLATTSCTLLPILALLFFGGSTLKDFAFALLIGVASGAYSSIFIASPVLTHWKEREPAYRARRNRIEAEFGHVAAYADRGADVEPVATRARRRAGRLTEPEPESVSAAEFEQMKRELELEPQAPSRQTSTLTRRLAQTDDAPARAKPRPRTDGAPRGKTEPRGDGAPAPDDGAPAPTPDVRSPAPAPDVPENEGVAPTPPKRKGASKSRGRNRRHGRRR